MQEEVEFLVSRLRRGELSIEVLEVAAHFDLQAASLAIAGQGNCSSKHVAALEANSRLLKRIVTGGEASLAVSLSHRPCRHPFPFRHRVLDVSVDHEWYRISRCAACSERLFSRRVPGERASHVAGVPVELSGAALLDWADDESYLPSEEPQELPPRRVDLPVSYSTMAELLPGDVLITVCRAFLGLIAVQGPTGHESLLTICRDLSSTENVATYAQGVCEQLKVTAAEAELSNLYGVIAEGAEPDSEGSLTLLRGLFAYAASEYRWQGFRDLRWFEASARALFRVALQMVDSDVLSQAVGSLLQDLLGGRDSTAEAGPSS